MVSRWTEHPFEKIWEITEGLIDFPLRSRWIGENTNLVRCSESWAMPGENELVLYCSQMQSGQALLNTETRSFSSGVELFRCWQKLSCLGMSPAVVVVFDVEGTTGWEVENSPENRLNAEESLEHSGHFFGIKCHYPFMLVIIFLNKICDSTVTYELKISI